MTKIDRVNKVIAWLFFTGFAKNKTELAKKMGYTKSPFVQILKGGVPLSERFIDNLCATDNNILKEWIISGNGQMLAEQLPEEQNYRNRQRDRNRPAGENNFIINRTDQKLNIQNRDDNKDHCAEIDKLKNEILRLNMILNNKNEEIISLLKSNRNSL